MDTIPNELVYHILWVFVKTPKLYVCRRWAYCVFSAQEIKILSTAQLSLAAVVKTKNLRAVKRWHFFEEPSINATFYALHCAWMLSLYDCVVYLQNKHSCVITDSYYKNNTKDAKMLALFAKNTTE